MRYDLDVEIKPGEPLQLAIEDIDEDPGQPRREFDEAALRELAETIKAGGVRQPISVRVHPNDPERWMLNFGARRLRASRLAGKTDIPGFVDKTTNSYDQVIENEQREGLTALELALFVQARLDEGESQADIARRLGKGRSYVTYATALIDAPDWLMDMYRQGRCRGARELHELRRLQEAHPDCARDLDSETGPVTRERIAALKTSVSADCGRASTALAEHGQVRMQNTHVVDGQADILRQGVEGISASTPPRAKPKESETPARGRAQPATDVPPKLLARLDDEVVEIVTTAVPPEAGHIFVSTSANLLRAVEAGRLHLLRIVAG
jgi:ParB family chromosome partitioning protein